MVSLATKIEDKLAGTLLPQLTKFNNNLYEKTLAFYEKHEKIIKNIYLIAATAFFGGTVLNLIGIPLFGCFVLFTLVSPIAAIVPAAVILALGVGVIAYMAKSACEFYGSFDAFSKSLSNFKYEILEIFTKD